MENTTETMKILTDYSDSIKEKLDLLDQYSAKYDHKLKQKNCRVLERKEEEILNKQIRLISLEFQNNAAIVKQKLDEFKNSVLEDEKTKMFESYKDMIEIKKVRFNTLTETFRNTFKKFCDLKSLDSSSEGNKIFKHYKINYPNITDEAIKDKIKAESSINNNTNPLCSKESNSILKSAETRRIRLQEISAEISVIVGMIDQLKNLVHDSSQTIDQIHIDMTHARIESEKAKKSLMNALVYQCTATKLFRIVICIAVAFIFILVCLTIISFSKLITKTFKLQKLYKKQKF